MTCDELLQSLRANPLAGWICQSQDDFLRLQLPMRYSDGGAIEVFVEERGAGFVVTDFGEAYRFLDSGGVDMTRSSTKRRIATLAAQLGEATENEGSFEIVVNAADRIAPAAIQLGQVISRVGDIMLLSKGALGSAFADQLADYLRESTRGVEITRHAPIEGAAQSWHVDILAKSMNRLAAVQCLSAVSPGGANAQSAFTIMKFLDMGRAANAPHRFSVLDDDESDVWSINLRQQLATVCDVVDWQQRDQVVAYLAA